MFTIIGGDGREYGPVSAEKIRAWIVAGRADLSTQAKAEGTAEWKPLGAYPEFAGGEPPPLAAGGATAAPAAPLAGRGARLAAALIDFLVTSVCLIPACRIFLATDFAQALARGEQPDLSDLSSLTPFLHAAQLTYLLVILGQSVLLALRSQTLGKLLLRIRIARHGAGGAPAGFARTVVLRTWLPFALRFIPLLGALFALVDVLFIFGEERRCLHDLIAGTQVVRDDPVSGRP
jgi:uncharacterized RDD family membrane protein YckC